MNKKIHHIIILFIFIILSTLNCSDNKSPAIYFDGEKYKFGKVLECKENVFTFFFFNKGKMDLIINELDVSCYCVVVKEYDKRVKPGKRGKIYGFLQTKGFQGEVIKAIKVNTNIPDMEPVVLTLEGNILPRPK